MLIVRMTLKSIVRREFKSAVLLSVSLALALFLAVYANVITRHLQTLADLHDNIEVTAAFTDPYCKSRSSLNLPEVYIFALEDSGFIQKKFYTRDIVYQLEPWEEEVAENQFPVRPKRLVGANAFEAILDFGHEAAVMPHFLEGYDKSLFGGEERVCIVSSKLAMTLGDEITLTVAELPSTHPERILHGTVTLKIAGEYPSRHDETIYCPWAVMDEIYTELGLPMTWDSASYILQNTENLNQLKSMLQTMQINSPGVPDNQVTHLHPGFVIDDNLLKRAVGSVKKYVDFMRTLYLPIYLLCAGIGFVISYLVIRQRKPELAIMRSLGSSRSKAFAILFLEQSLLCLAGTALGMGLASAISGTLAPLQLLSILGFILCYWLGAALAILMINQDNVIQILWEKE